MLDSQHVELRISLLTNGKKTKQLLETRRARAPGRHDETGNTPHVRIAHIRADNARKRQKRNTKMDNTRMTKHKLSSDGMRIHNREETFPPVTGGNN